MLSINTVSKMSYDTHKFRADVVCDTVPTAISSIHLSLVTET